MDMTHVARKFYFQAANRQVAFTAASLLLALLLSACAPAPPVTDFISAHTACPARVDYIQVAWSPDGSQLVTIAQQAVTGSPSTFDLLTMTDTGRPLTTLDSNRDSLSWVAWSPGQTILYTTALDLYEVNPDGSQRHRLPLDGVQTAAWSPDGKQFAYTQAAGDVNQLSIGIASADGFHTSDLGKGDAPIVSPDGARLLFTTYDRAGRPQVSVEDADAAHFVQLTSDPHNNGPADWSPNGARIAFTSNRAGPTSDLYLMDADGSHVSRLTTAGHVTSMPAWSPKGDRIAFIADFSGASAIYTLKVDGSALTQLTSTPGGLCLH